ncbi:class IV adenylate cyclase [Corallococcus exercitus]|uniref:Class IV adenylate cyclase n=1 Tax=Corallococcus exercitus TaxID=2316736 RepID=A0A7Y4JXR0_9BACT|nr:class IV adenylate cyclase [Corallococcus exercitus]NOK12182.1 class IV adenylate cyclase [Corallococcus exercitus]
MQELELKSVVDDVTLRRRRVEEAGGTLRFAGTMVDRYYQFASQPPEGGQRLRVRTYQSPGNGWAELTWKGPARLEQGYKEREELTTRVGDEATLRHILERSGFTPHDHVTRDIAWYTFGAATLRFEQFPRMDMLLEVEGPPEHIERAIHATGIPRSRFTTDPLAVFIHRFETRTGKSARLHEELHEATLCL